MEGSLMTPTATDNVRKRARFNADLRQGSEAVECGGGSKEVENTSITPSGRHKRTERSDDEYDSFTIGCPELGSDFSHTSHRSLPSGASTGSSSSSSPPNLLSLPPSPIRRGRKIECKEEEEVRLASGEEEEEEEGSISFSRATSSSLDELQGASNVIMASTPLFGGLEPFTASGVSPGSLNFLPSVSLHSRAAALREHQEGFQEEAHEHRQEQIFHEEELHTPSFLSSHNAHLLDQESASSAESMEDEMDKDSNSNGSTSSDQTGQRKRKSRNFFSSALPFTSPRRSSRHRTSTPDLQSLSPTSKKLSTLNNNLETLVPYESKFSFSNFSAFLSVLPEDLILHTFSFLQAEKLCLLACVNREMRALANKPYLWRRLCVMHFRAELLYFQSKCRTVLQTQTSKSLYRTICNMSIDLEFLSGPCTGRVHTIARKSGCVVTIGRSRSNDVSIGHDEMISRKHAIITHHDNRLWLRDVGGINGTYLNDSCLPQYVDVPLSLGSMVELGASSFAVSPHSHNPLRLGRKPKRHIQV